jgi:pyruvate,orthophosphate dikinase
MFLGEERVASVRKMIFADTDEEEKTAYDELLPLQRNDFLGIFEAMDGLPVTVRLLDPPLHEFLPDQVDLAVDVAVTESKLEARKNAEETARDKAKQEAEARRPLEKVVGTGLNVAQKVPGVGDVVEGSLRAGQPDRAEEVRVDDVLDEIDENELNEKREILSKVNELHEANPMLGLRGVRLGILKPGLYAMQVRAIVEAAIELKKRGLDPRPEIMIPLTATAEELRQMREELDPMARQLIAQAGIELHIEFGTMIELPRACVTADEIAQHSDFFSFGTNDLTQTAFGFSRDDIGKFLAMYEERKLVPTNPFVSIDRAGVGRLMQIAVEEGRASNGTLHLGICGEHGGDPDSVVFCDELGLDYVSCSPYRVPVARLAAAQAVMGSEGSAST